MPFYTLINKVALQCFVVNQFVAFIDSINTFQKPIFTFNIKSHDTITCRHLRHVLLSRMTAKTFMVHFASLICAEFQFEDIKIENGL